MIVLDEQLIGYGLQAEIARWYRGTVTDITRLRPGTVILDEEIPKLLREVDRPTFVTLNVQDFWKRLAPDANFLAACFALPDSQAAQVSALLRRLFALPPFRTRRIRLGKVARVSPQSVQYYTTADRKVVKLMWD